MRAGNRCSQSTGLGAPGAVRTRRAGGGVQDSELGRHGTQIAGAGACGRAVLDCFSAMTWQVTTGPTNASGGLRVQGCASLTTAVARAHGSRQGVVSDSALSFGTHSTSARSSYYGRGCMLCVRGAGLPPAWRPPAGRAPAVSGGGAACRTRGPGLPRERHTAVVPHRCTEEHTAGWSGPPARLLGFRQRELTCERRRSTPTSGPGPAPRLRPGLPLRRCALVHAGCAHPAAAVCSRGDASVGCRVSSPCVSGQNTTRPATFFA